MSANIEMVDGKACMAYAGLEKPWHGLGTSVSADMTPEEMLDAAGINWHVRLADMWTNTKAWGPRKSALVKCLMRIEDGKELSIVGPEYVPTQNQDAFRFFKRFVEAGHMKMDTAGSLQEGRRIWGLASIQDSFTLAGGDKVDGYLLVSSPHIYGESLQIKFVATRVVCWNTLSMALKEKTGRGKWRMLHLQSFDEKQMAKAELALGISKSLLGDLKEKATLLSSVKADERQVSKYVMQLFDKQLLDTVVEVQAAKKAGEQMPAKTLDELLAASELSESEKKFQKLVAMKPSELDAWAKDEMNRAGKKVLNAILESPGSQMESAKGTWWGALNGVTYTVDHTIGRDQDAMLTSAWLGQRATLKENALDLAVEYATAQQGSKSYARTL